MVKVLKLCLLIFLFNLQTIYSQEKSATKFLNKELISVSNKFKSEVFFKKAVIFFTQKEWDSTLIYSQKQLTTSKKKYLRDFSHYLRGYSFNNKKLFKEAENEFNFISKNFIFFNSVRTFLGLLSLEQNQFKKAIIYFEPLINLPENEYKFIKKSAIIHNLGLCYLHLKDFSRAKTYLSQSLKIKEKEKDTIKIISSYGDVATLYYEQYKDDLAIPYFIKAYKLSSKTKNFDLKRKTAKNMAVVEENRKDYKKALLYRKESEQWKDSLNNQNKIYEVAKLEKEFAVKEKQKEVDILQVQNELKEMQRNIYLFVAIGLLVLLSIGSYYYREKVKNSKIIAKQKENLDVLNATKDKLFSIVSHDLRSSVNALKTSNVSLIKNLENKNLDALPKLLQHNSFIVNGAYRLLDNLLNWALLQTEQGYFSIEEVRLFFIVEHVSYNYKPLLLEKELKFENRVSKKDLILVDQESIKIVFRNLIDNAIKFSNTKGSIKIYSRNNSDNFCDLIIEDSGLGIGNAVRLKLLEDTTLLAKKEHEDIIGTGLGLQLCKSMIAKNNGKFTIESELGKGTKMIVSLPKTQGNG